MAADETTNPNEAIDKIPTSFAGVVKEHWEGIYRLLFSLSGRTHEAEDLTQETFLRALRSFGSLRPGTRMRAWLMRIATNAYFDQQRHRKRLRIEGLECDHPSLTETPGHALEIAEEAANVQKAMMELTELTRLVFHLRVQEELSFREIAELVGTSEQAARWHMHHARTRLLDLLGQRDRSNDIT